MTTEFKHRSDASMPYQEWKPFDDDSLVEIENAYGDKRIGLVKDFWWGYERELGSIGEGVILKVRKIEDMMTEHDAVPGTEYYNQHDTFVVPGDVMKELQEFTQRWESEEMLVHAWPEEQEQDEEEMSQWYEFDAYQDFTDETAIYPEEKGLEYTALGLASEAGEFAGKVKKWIRDGKKDDDALVAELGDVLWYVARAAAELEVHLSDVTKTNVEKLKSRKERNVIKGEGDNR